jgi:hypothetical protein
MDITFSAGIGRVRVKSNPINLFKSCGSLYGIAASRDGVVITG